MLPLLAVGAAIGAPHVHRLDGSPKLREALGGFCPGKPSSANSIREALEKHAAGLVIDVGAFDGKDAVNYAKAGHEVLSFEPSPANIVHVRRRFANTTVGGRITFYPVALADREGNATFSGQGRPGETGALGAFIESAAPTKRRLKATQVPVRTLDSVVGERSVLLVAVAPL